MSKLIMILLLLPVILAASDKPEIVPVNGQQLRQIINDSKESVVVVNLWATWCAPCVQEFPELVEFNKEYSGKDIRLIFVSGDFDDQMDHLRQFLSKHGVEYTTYIKTGDDMAFIESFEPVSWQGALPLTIVYNAKREPVASFNKKVTKEELSEVVDGLLAQN